MTEHSSTEKTFLITPNELRNLALGRGACIASDRILVDGCRIGYMYREESEEETDSGWCFFSGDETQEYIDDANNLGYYDVNTVANYDPEIVTLLDAPYGSVFVRDETGLLIPIGEAT
jgi:hypothetical protein